jgi:hypothetical protein
MPADIEIASHFNMRIDPQLRYLTEIAAKTKSMTVSQYIEAVLWDSFKNVSLDDFALEDEPIQKGLSPAQRFSRLRDRPVVSPLSEVTDQLWSEHPLIRIQLLAVHFEHLMTDDQKKIWNYLFTREDLKKDGKFDRKLVAERWTQIKAAALSDSKAKAGSK